MRDDVSKSLDTARIAIPILVCLISITSSTTSTIVSTGVIRVTILVVADPIVTVFCSQFIAGYVLVRPPVIYRAKFCSRYDTPMAEIIIDILGADLRGRYATFSMVVPRTIAKMITKITESHNGRTVIIYTMISPDHMKTIETNLPVLTQYCDMKPYEGNGDYESLRKYLKEAERVLSKRGNQATLEDDRLMAEFLRNNGKDAMLQLKRDNFNLKLEEFVVGADNARMLDVVDNYIVPRAGLIYLTPASTVGRAPFYSSEKIIGTHHIKTLWFNMSVLLLMSVIVIILLLTDCPGRYVRKDNNS